MKDYYVGDFEITKREILVSISIISIMLLLGFLISNRILEYQMDQDEIYNKAVKIENTDLFKYGMKTNVGNAFVYGELNTVDPVTYPEIGGAYMYVEKVKEKYTMHTRTVTYTTGSGSNTQTHTRVETYWTWDRVGYEDIKCKKVSFLGVEFESNRFILPNSEYIKTIQESSSIRYKYYGVKTKHFLTIFTKLEDNTFSDAKFYYDSTIQETIRYLESNGALVIIFWIFWLMLISGCVIGFYYIDNRWLE